MKLVIQRVRKAQVTLEDGRISGSIGKGLLILLGIGPEDTEVMAERYVEKLIKLRIFEDENGKTNKSIADVDGDFLVVSQFTLYADCKKGNRPSFTGAAAPTRAEELYEYFLTCLGKVYREAQHGSFGAMMQVSLENDGPFTLVWDSAEWY